MKKNKPRQKGGTITHANHLWANAIGGAVLLSLIICLFSWFITSYSPKESNIGLLLCIICLFLPFIAFLFLVVIASILQRNDYIHFSKEGIDFVLHPYTWLWEKRVSGFIRWDEIEEYKVINIGRFNTNRYIFLKLYNEGKPIRLGVEYLQEKGERVSCFLHRFIPEKECAESNRSSVLECFLCVLFIGSILLLLPCFDLYDKTFIVSWFWFPIMVGCMLVIVPLARHYQLDNNLNIGIIECYASAFSIGLILCYGVLKVNYVFADWEREPTVRTCEFISVSAQYPSRGPKRIIGYSLKINTGKEIKSIDVSTPNQGQTDKTIDFYVYKGALGLDVME